MFGYFISNISNYNANNNRANKFMNNQDDILVEVENLSKKFCLSLKKSLWFGLVDSFRALFNFRSKIHFGIRKDEFWAIQNVSFKLKRGECIGLIGHNGAGKSTLLKLINGIILPDQGRVKTNGNVGALIELGAGFNPILTGRENIYNNAAVLGFKKQEIDEKIDEIIRFSELNEFIDMAVQNYSSGMKIRLGFVVAANLEPDILLIDEVLAVGDLGFVLKCFDVIDKILPKTAVIFVSHSMPMVSRVCNQILLLEKGKVKYKGFNVGEGIDKYYSLFGNNESNVVYSKNIFELLDIYFLNNESIVWNGEMSVFFKLKVLQEITEFLVLIIEFKDKEQRPVASLKNDMHTAEFQKNTINNFKLTVENTPFSKGVYSLDLAIIKKSNNSPLLRVNNCLSFQLIDNDQMWASIKLNSKLQSID